jgi:hypothetical protein
LPPSEGGPPASGSPTTPRAQPPDASESETPASDRPTWRPPRPRATSGTSTASGETPEPTTPRATALRAAPPTGTLISGTGLAAGAVDAAFDIATIYLQQWLQTTFYDAQNRAAFERNLAREQPRITRMLERYVEAVQRLRAMGGTPYAVITLHVVYRTYAMPDEHALAHSSFEDVWVESVLVESAPRQGERGVYEGRDPLATLTDPEALGRNFRNETHTLVTFSSEIPDAGVFARPSLTSLAERLANMYRYVARIGGQPDTAEEASALIRQMRDLAARTIDVANDRVREQLLRELMTVTGGDTDVATGVLRSLR